MGISAVDELLVQRIFDRKPPPRIQIPFIVHEVLLFLISWLGLFFLDEPRVRLIKGRLLSALIKADLFL